MKRILVAIMGLFALVLTLGSAQCRPVEAPDDIIAVPGVGVGYRANCHQAGKKNLWPPIESTELKLKLGDSAFYTDLSYRSYIDTKAGETRNNIIFIRAGDAYITVFHKLLLEMSDIPDGLEVKEVDGGGGPGSVSKVIAITIAKPVQPGEYTFNIRIIFDGDDYGTVPCTIRVVR